MAGAPIPSDWDGVSWCCEVIELPASQSWRAVFIGLLLNPTHGRFWDETTGIVTDAQAVAKEMAERNCAFLPEGES